MYTYIPNVNNIQNKNMIEATITNVFANPHLSHNLKLAI